MCTVWTLQIASKAMCQSKTITEIFLIGCPKWTIEMSTAFQILSHSRRSFNLCFRYQWTLLRGDLKLELDEFEGEFRKIYEADFVLVRRQDRKALWNMTIICISFKLYLICDLLLYCSKYYRIQTDLILVQYVILKLYNQSFADLK